MFDTDKHTINIHLMYGPKGTVTVSSVFPRVLMFPRDEVQGNI